jgi:hypothetical protein
MQAEPMASAPFAVASSRDLEVIATAAGGVIEDETPEVTDQVRPRPKLRPRAWAKSTQRTRPEPGPRAARVPSLPCSDRQARPIASRGRNAVWLILLMLALGSGAMVAAYFWPDL